MPPVRLKSVIQLAIILLCLSLWPGLAQAQEGGNLRFERLTIETGLSQNTVRTIWQDRQGLLWFGTQDGLNKYDGYSFTIYKHNPEDPASISDNFIRVIFEDQAGTLWLGTNGGLNRVDPVGPTFIAYQHDPDDPQTLSSDTILDIFEDQSGSLWIGTSAGLNKFDPATGRVRRYQPDPADPNSLASEMVRDITQGADGRLWVGTEGGGLELFDPATETFTHYVHDPANPASLSHNDISTVHVDPAGVVWITTEGGGLNRFDPATETFTVYRHDPADPASLPDDNLRSLYQDASGLLWIGTWGGGLSRFDPASGTALTYRFDPLTPNSLSGDQVLTVYEDRGGVFWVGTNGTGLSKFKRSTEVFIHYTNTGGASASLSDSIVWGITEDPAGQLWVGTSSGLNRIERASGMVTVYRLQPDDPASLSGDFIPAVLTDHSGTLWVGVDEGGLNRYDPATDSFSAYRFAEEDPTSLSDDDVWSLFEDREGRLWVGTWGGGLNRFNPTDETFTRYQPDPANPTGLSNDVIRVIRQDHTGRLWLGTNGGGLVNFDPAAETFTTYLTDPNEMSSLSGNVVRAILEDSRQTLWVGVDGGGLNKFDLAMETFVHYREQDGLPNDTIYGIVEDDQGDLWLSTNSGLARFDPTTETFKNYTASDGLQSNEFNQGAYFKSGAGELFFGGINGFNAFFPDRIQDNAYQPPVIVTAFQIFDKPVTLAQPLAELTELPLSYRDSVFSFEFAALDYTAPAENQYAYKLEGFDQEWIEAGPRRFATYTNLDGGDYTFRVRGTNNDGLWSENEVAVKINITPPPWQTWWAYTLYVLAGAGVIFVYIRLRTRAQARELAQQRRELAQERQVAEQLRQVDRLKDEFLANTSHELRTPLNGIIGLAESLLEGATGELAPDTRHNLSLIAMSGRRLANLVNDVLDFAKLKHKTIQLDRRPVDLRALTEVVLTLSQPLVGPKAVQLVNNIPADTPLVNADERRIEQVMHNLVGNAIKFTESGIIEISAQVRDQQLAVSVTDSGIGIPADKIGRIFESFEQADGSIERIYGGSGLGLTISKQLVELHGGTITVDSTVNQGSRFTFTLPLSSAPLPAPPVAPPPPESLAEDAPVYAPRYQAEPAEAPPIKMEEEEGDFTILVVDDEPVNLQVLSNHLSLENYAVVPVMSGPEALLAIENGLQPDLILLDVMMPRMSGYEVCRKLRQQYTMFELPILILTAKNQTEDLLAGFEAGANDYLTKPVGKSALLARVKTQLTLKEAVKARHLLWSLHQELDIARKIQNSFLLPPKPDWSQPAIVCFSAPASEVGGDFYLYHAFEGVEARRFAVAVGDVTGKGIPAAMLMAGSIASLQAILSETLPPERLLAKLDKAIGLHTQTANQNCALCYAELTVPRNGQPNGQASSGNGHHPPATLRVANAGCIPPLIRRAGGSTEWVDVVGLPLGLALGLSLGYEPATTELHSGDLVVLTSDGLVEATAPNKELFGFERLEQAVASGPTHHPEAMVAHLRAEVNAFLGPAEIHDDVTIVVLQV